MKIDTLIELKQRMEKIIASFFIHLDERVDEDMTIITPFGDSFFDGTQQHIFLDTPSLNESTIFLDVRDNTLLFQGEKSVEKPDCDTVFLHMERSFGSYLKLVPLAKEREEYSGCTTSYNDGVLHITVAFGG